MIKNDETLKPSLIKSLGASIRLSQMNLKLNFLYYSSVHADSDILEMPGRELFHSRREDFRFHGENRGTWLDIRGSKIGSHF